MFSIQRTNGHYKASTFFWDTYCLYYEKYPWARMCPTIHKLLKHGCEIAEQLSLPVAYFSEDAIESSHKIYRQNMTRDARQSSRENRLKDVFHRAIYLSDPKISLIYLFGKSKYDFK